MATKSRNAESRNVPRPSSPGVDEPRGPHGQVQVRGVAEVRGVTEARGPQRQVHVAGVAEAPFAYEGLDRVIHERARLSVLTSLITHPKGLTFNDLKQLCALTDGNLSRHLSVLEEEKIVEILKGHTHNRPQTLCRITASGRKRYLDYLTTLEQVVRDAAGAAKQTSATGLLRGLTPSKA